MSAIFALEDGRLLPSSIGLSDEQAAALDLTRHVVVVAGAGSGKTRTLTRRYLRILGALAWEAGDAERAPGPEAILVTTFTERAAAEMRGRIRGELGQAVRELGDRHDELAALVGAERVGHLRRHLAAARDGFARARIGTFHAFAGSVLREFAATAGLDPGFAILDSFDEIALREQAVEAALGEAERCGEPAALFGAFDRRAALEALRIWVKRRHDLGPFLHTLERSDEEVLELWHHRYADIELDEVEAAFDPRGALFDDLERFIDLENDLRNPGAPPPAIVMTKRALELMGTGAPTHPVERADRLRAIASCFQRKGDSRALYTSHYLWLGKTDAVRYPERRREFSEAWDDLRPRLAAVLGEHGERLHSLLGGADRLGLPALRALAAVGERAVQHYQEGLEASRSLDFSELEARVLRLLESEPRVRERLSSRFRHLLVDEFQDTNTTQWRVTRLVAGTPLPPAGLFVVGDPKQAIYRFRGGDVTVFERARAELAAAGGREVGFTGNFRSRSALIDGFNDLFDWLMPSGDAPPWEARFEALTARRADADADPGRIDLIWMTEEAVEPAEPEPEDGALEELEPEPEPETVDLLALDEAERAAAEAESLPLEYGNLPPVHREAKLVAALLKDVLLPSSDEHDGVRVAILLRRRTHLPVYARALREADVPHVVGSGRGFFGRQEVVDLANLLLALAHPDDGIALLGALRGPLLRVEDAWLVWLARLRRSAREQALQAGWRDVLLLVASQGSERRDREEAAGWSELPEAGRAALTEAAERFLRWRALSRELPLSAFLRQVITETASVYGLARTDPTGQAMANVEKLISLALTWDSRGAEGLADFGLFLVRQDDLGASEGEATLDSTAPVRVMTIHQSKGLEFPCVVLPDLLQRLRWTGRDPVLMARLPGADVDPEAPDLWEPGIAVPVVEEGRRTKSDMLLRRLIKGQDRQEELAEARRLLYVAATRARDRLVTLSLPLPTSAWDRIEKGAHKDEAQSWSEWVRMWVEGRSPGVRLHELGPDDLFPSRELVLDAAAARDRLGERAWSAAPPPAPSPGDRRALARALAPVEAEPVRRTSPHTLQTEAPRALPVDSGLRPPPELDPRDAGLLRGLLVHACLEDGLTRPSPLLRRRVRQALAEAGQRTEPAEEWLHAALVRHLRGYRKAAPDALEDGTVFHEVPFRLRMPVSAVGGGESWLDGVIDVLYRRPEDRCWMVLDYKTDEGDPEALAPGYAPQILAYAWAASRVLPEVRDAGWRVGGELLFTGAGRRVQLFEPGTADQIGEAFRRHLREAPLFAEP